MDSGLVLEPKDFLGHVMCSLGDGCTQSYVTENSQLGFRYEISFKGKSSPVFGDKIQLSLSGPFERHQDTAMRGAILCLVAAIRDDYGVLVGDYSYSKIIKVYDHYDCAEQRIQNECHQFKNCINEFLVSAGEVPELRSLYRRKGDLLASAARGIALKVNGLNDSVGAMVKVVSVENDPACFFKAVGGCIAMSEEESFHLVQFLYGAVMRFQYGTIPLITTTRIGDYHSFLSSVVILDVKVTAMGDVRAEEYSAMVDCMIKVLEHVEAKYGVFVRDVTFGLWQAMRETIDRCDENVEFISAQCREIVDATAQCFDAIKQELGDVSNSMEIGGYHEAAVKAAVDLVEWLCGRKDAVGRCVGMI